MLFSANFAKILIQLYSGHQKACITACEIHYGKYIKRGASSLGKNKIKNFR